MSTLNTPRDTFEPPLHILSLDTRERGACLFSTSHLQEAEGSNKVIPQPPFLQASQT